MIAFIIIGRNVAKTIEACLKSVVQFINTNNLQKSEIIYVDSDSVDSSIKIAKLFPVMIIQVQGEINAAVGRNVGASHAVGDVLFFIDGDMEIIPGLYKYLFNGEKLVYPFITGFLINRYFSTDYTKVLSSEKIVDQSGSPSFTEKFSAGGLFIIEKQKWFEISGMDEKLDTNEDVDFSLRMSIRGNKVRIYERALAIHNTVSYYNNHRLKAFIKGKQLLYPGVLIRKYLFNAKIIRFIIRSRYSLLLFVFLLVFFVIDMQTAKYLSIFYLLVQLLRSYVVYKREGHFWAVFLFKLLLDLYSLIGFVIFYPKKKKYLVNVIQ